MSGWHNFRELYDNRIILRRLRRNDAGDKKTLWIQNHHEKKGKKCIDYCPEGAYDMGSLGYFVGKSDHLDPLNQCLEQVLGCY